MKDLEKKLRQMDEEHLDRLEKVDWSDPKSLLREVQYAKSLDEKKKAMVESLPEQPKTIQ